MTLPSGDMTLPRVIVLTTLKGGSGKSTVAACLAAHWHHAGRSPALVDADPQRSIANWSALNSLDLPVAMDATEGVAVTVAGLARDHRPVVVDTAGFRNRTTIEAIASADLAIVPVKPSPMDVAVARDTAELVADRQRAKNMPSPAPSSKRDILRNVLSSTSRTPARSQPPSKGRAGFRQPRTVLLPRPHRSRRRHPHHPPVGHPSPIPNPNEALQPH